MDDDTLAALRPPCIVARMELFRFTVGLTCMKPHGACASQQRYRGRRWRVPLRC